MFKKLKCILALLSLGTLAAGLAACATSKSPIPDLEAQGYKIQITYDSNGGKMLESENSKIMDLYKPDEFEKSADGKIEIKLTEPQSSVRPKPATLTKQEHFFTGWYATRNIMKNEQGEVINEKGEVLTETLDGYVIKGTENNEKPQSSEPAYTYDDLWDFETDTFTYEESEGKKEFTLYAGWVQYYEFNYYFKNENGEWEKSNSTYSFDYKTTNAPGSTTSDRDTIFLPVWNDGDITVQYKHTYNNQKDTYEFPKVSGTTFFKAYKDEACTQEITDGYLKHEGTLDVATATAINRIQNVYVEVVEGERYKISNAKQLSENGNSLGWYEISSDLDFTDLTWPAVFMSGEFKGRFYSSDSQVREFKNISATYTNRYNEYGGLFGVITQSAVFENITFKAPSLSINIELKKSEEAEDKTLVVKLGLFAGSVENGATITNSKLDGGVLEVVNMPLVNLPVLNLFTYEGRGPEAVGQFTLRFLSSRFINGRGYRYEYRANQATIAADGTVSYSYGSYYDEKENFEIIYSV